MTEEVLEAWLQCERRAWLERHRPDLRSRAGGLEQYLRLQRADLQHAYARVLARTTREVVAAAPGAVTDLDAWLGAGAVLDASLAATAADGTRLRAHLDVLMHESGGWAIETIAAGARARPHHLRRLAFASLAAESRGLAIRRCAVVHVAREPRGDRPPVRVRNVTIPTRKAQAKLPARLQAAAASVTAGREPRTAIGAHCRRPRECPFRGHCWEPYGASTIFHVPELSRGTRHALRSAGWQDARTLPQRIPGLTTPERRAFEDARRGHVQVDIPALRAGLGQLTAPVAYLDMEFATPSVPWLPDMIPFQPLPFQFSVDLEDEGGTVRHMGHLHERADRDPRPELAEALAAVLGQAASVVVYDASAERRLLAELAEAAPNVAGALRSASERIWDLLAVVRATLHHPGFGAGLGLKRVASTLAPGSYAAVALPDGLAAQAAWRHLLRSGDPTLAARLKTYCAADSRALVRVVRVLRQWAAEGEAEPGRA